jgi:Caspase domain
MDRVLLVSSITAAMAQLTRTPRINYLIPVDVANAEDEDLWNYSLNLNTVVENLRAQAPSATHYVVFDACRNELNLTRKGEKALSEKGFVPMAYTPGVMVAYSTAPGRTASDSGAGGGAYAKALAEEIVRPGVESMLVFTRVARRVQREIGQDPFLSASTMPEVYFATDAKVATVTQLPRVDSQIQASEAERAWALVKDTNNQSVLEAFVKQFGDTIYSAIARARIKELKNQEIAAASLPAVPGKSPQPESADPEHLIGVWKCREVARKMAKIFRTCTRKLIFDKYDGTYYWASSDAVVCSNGFSVTSKYKFWVDRGNLYLATYRTSNPRAQKYLGEKIRVIRQGDEITYGYERESSTYQLNCAR